MSDRPIRQTRAKYVKPFSQLTRKCRKCGTDYLATEGGASERGPWAHWSWFCSVECAPALSVTESTESKR